MVRLIFPIVRGAARFSRHRENADHKDRGAGRSLSPQYVLDFVMCRTLRDVRYSKTAVDTICCSICGLVMNIIDFVE